MAKRVWILGAGASKGHARGQFPVITEIFKYARRLEITTADKQQIYKDLSDYVADNLGASIFNQKSEIDVEQLLTFLDIDFQNTGDPFFLILRKQVVSLVVEVLERQREVIGAAGSSYELFVNKLTDTDIVISFNWDTFLDSLLMGGGPDFEPMPAMRNSLDRFIYDSEWISTWGRGLDAPTDREPRLARPRESGEVWQAFYLKLHGSTDWVACKNEFCAAKGHLFVVKNPLAQKICGKCDEPVEPILVPPVLNKNLHSIPAVRRIWTIASRLLIDAEEVILWGYRLPPTDFYAEHLLRNASPKNLKRVIVINPETRAGGGKRVPEIVKRFEKVFRIDILFDIETYIDFEEFDVLAHL